MNRYLVMRCKTGDKKTGKDYRKVYSASGCWSMLVLVVSISVNAIGPRLE